MILLKDQPTLTDLHEAIDSVPAYPIMVRELIDLARQANAPQSVIDFYQAFPDDEIFEDREDLLSRTENVDILQHQDPPEEEMHTPEED